MKSSWKNWHAVQQFVEKKNSVNNITSKNSKCTELDQGALTIPPPPPFKNISLYYFVFIIKIINAKLNLIMDDNWSYIYYI